MLYSPRRSGFALLGLCLASAVIGGCEERAVPSNLFIDAQGYVNVTLRNDGTDTIPANRGDLAIYVDERLIKAYQLGELPDQSFREVGGSTTFRSDVRVSGLQRRVLVRIDRAREFNQNHFQDSLSWRLDAPSTAGPDFVIEELSLDPNNELLVGIANHGNRGTASRGTLFVSVDGVPLAEETVSTRRLGLNETMFVHVDAPIPSGALVEAHLVFDARYDIDTTNNFRDARLGADGILTPYLELLDQIGHTVRWYAAGPKIWRKYKYWTAEQQADLQQAILRIESGVAQPMVEPPDGPLYPAGLRPQIVTADAAWQIYIEHVAHSLWLEVHHRVPWSLLDFSDEELESLLHGRAFWYGPEVIGTPYLPRFSSTGWNPRLAYGFLQSMGLVANSQEETIYGLTDVMRGRFVHFSEAGLSNADEREEIYDFRGVPPVDRVLYPKQGEPVITWGCWGTTGVYISLLRALNVPVTEGRILLRGGEHSHPIFLHANLSMPHADNVYNQLTVPSGAVIPTSELFYTLEEMQTRFISPTDLNCDAEGCVSPDVQAAYNNSKDLYSLAIEYMPDHLPYERTYGTGDLDDDLRGDVARYRKPLFEDAERAAIIEDAEEAIRHAGGGDFLKGAGVIRNRWRQFWSNRFSPI